MPHHHFERLLDERQRQQVVQMAGRHGGPAKVFGDEGRLEAPDERGDFRNVREIKRHGRTQPQSDTVKTQRIVASDLLQYMQVKSTFAEIVLRMNFKPVYRLPCLQKIEVMRMAKTDAHAETVGRWRVCWAGTISWRGHRSFSSRGDLKVPFHPAFRRLPSTTS